MKDVQSPTIGSTSTGADGDGADRRQDVVIEARHLTAGYDKLREKVRLTALSDVSLTVRRGEFVVLVGPSGCGKTTGGQRGSRNEYVQSEILRGLGLDPEKDMEFVAIGGGSDARLQALLGGQVQAASVFPRHRAALEEAGGQFLHEDLIASPQEGMAAMGSWIEENRETLVAYLTANLRARQYLQDLSKRDEVIALMRENDFEIPEEFVPLYQIEIEQVSPDGGFEVAEMEELVSTELELGLLPEGMDWREHVDLEPLWEAQEAAGLPRRPESL